MAQGNLKKANEIITAIKQAQTDAKNAATGKMPDGSSIPNGLKPGGLEPYNPTGVVVSGNVPVTWSGISSLAETRSAPSDSATATVNITQSKQNAYLYWNKFNIGPQTTVNFDQSAGGQNVGNWIAFNKVMSPSSPSHIFGKINAQGQVYVLNQNGFLFHNGSAVNVNALVASALPINPGLSGIPATGTSSSGGNGLLNLTKGSAEFLFDVAHGTGGGDVTVEQGATLVASSRNGTGGKIALIGKNVANNGAISTPDGQTILAAGQQVALSAHNATDLTLRGLDVYIGKVDGGNGKAVNSGLIDAPRGAVSMVGSSVAQSGAIDDSTSVSLNGRTDLLASFGAVPNANYDPTVQGSVPFINKSDGTLDLTGLIRILPEWTSSETAPGTALTLPSVVNMTGETIHLGGTSLLLAPGARMPTGLGSVIVRSRDGTQLTEGITMKAINGIILDQGAVVSAAGSTDVKALMAENFLTIQLRGGELADSPLLQNNDAIRGKDLVIDDRLSGVYNGQYWIGTPLGDATGFLNLIYRTVGELTTEGGSISMSSLNNRVSVAGGATVDVSGGWIEYQGGSFATSKLITSNGRIVDVSKATPDQIYKGIIKGVPINQPGYISGGNAGYFNLSAPSVSIAAPMTSKDGLFGRSVVGPYQIRTSSSGFTKSSLPMPGSLLVSSSEKAISFSRSDVDSGLQSGGTLVLSANLLGERGFGNLTVLDYAADITIPSGVSLSAPAIGAIQVDGVSRPGSSVFLSGANITVEGSITAPGGFISLNAFTVSPDDDAKNTASSGGNNLPPPLAPTANGSLILKQGAVLSTAGFLIDESRSPLSSAPIVIDGGSESDPVAGSALAGVSLSSFRADLMPGSVIDVSGGAYLRPGKLPIYGNAGSVSIATGSDPQNGYANPVPFMKANLTIPSLIQVSAPTGGWLHLGSSLQGYSGSSVSGSLSLQAPLIDIGGTAANQDALALDPGFFNQGGFSRFNLSGIGEKTQQRGIFLPAIDIAPGTIIAPVVESLELSYKTGLGFNLLPILYPAGYRNPASITLSATGFSDAADRETGEYSRFIRGDIVVGSGAQIVTDPWNASLIGALSPAGSPGSFKSISISGASVDLEGSLRSPGGSIKISSSSKSSQAYPLELYSKVRDEALVTLLIGKDAVIDVSGSSTQVLGSLGQRTLAYLNGGSISLSGNLFTASDAVISSKGAAGTADVREYLATGGTASRVPGYTSILEEGSGGSITLKGGEMLLNQSKLTAGSAGSMSSGGTILISSGVYVSRGDGGKTKSLSPSGFTLDSSDNPIANLVISSEVPSPSVAPTIGNSVTIWGSALGSGLTGVDTFSSGGFDAITLGGNVFFKDSFFSPIQAGRSLSVATGGALFANGSVTLQAPYVSLGTAYTGPVSTDSSDPANLKPDLSLKSILTENSLPYYVQTKSGLGNITVKADKLLDVGNLLLRNVGSLTLDVSGGDLRGYGTLEMAGSLTMRAGQIYPPTDMTFNVIAYNYNTVSGTPSTSVGAGITPGSIKIEPGNSTRQTPLSAGGTINVFADSIVQNGTLVAPFGAIRLGTTGSPELVQADGVSQEKADLFSQMTVPVSSSVTIGTTALASVSAWDPVSQTFMTVPYGYSTDGKNWIDPTGRDISGGVGMPLTDVQIQGLNVTDYGSTINLQAGGQLVDYQWVPGNGGSRNMLDGTVTTWNSAQVFSAGDLVSWGEQVWSSRSRNQGQTPPSSSSGASLYWSLAPQSYAILPGYQNGFAPLAAFNQLGGQSRYGLNNPALTANLGSESGFAGTMKPGDLFWDAVNGTTCTLLPALYAVLPGAFLIKSTSLAAPPLSLPDGTKVVLGSQYNAFNASEIHGDLLKNYLLYSGASLSHLAQYSLFGSSVTPGNFPITARSGSVIQPGINAGSLQVLGLVNLGFAGKISGSSMMGQAAVVDLAAPSFTIDGNFLNGINPTPGNPLQLSSLLIGGLRGSVNSADGVVPISVFSDSIDVVKDTVISVPDLILAVKSSLNIGDSVSIIASGSAPVASEKTTITGNGSLIRVSDDTAVTFSRTQDPKGVGSSLSISRGVSLKGSSLLIDSSAFVQINSAAVLNSSSVTIDAGAVALVLDPDKMPSYSSPQGTLVLADKTLASLAGVSSLNITSYSVLDLYGSSEGLPEAAFGSADMATLGLHAGEIRGFDLEGGTAAFSAQSISLDNSSAASTPGPVTASPDGILELNAATITIGKNTLAIDQFSHVSLNATGVIYGGSSGAVTVGSASLPSDLSVTSPLITAVAGANLHLLASGAMSLQSPDSDYATPPAVDPGSGSKLTFTSQSIDVATEISAPSGIISLHATSGDVYVGGSGAAVLDVSGKTKMVQSAAITSDAGTISLQSDVGNINLEGGATLNLSASGSSSAGTLQINAIQGHLSIDENADLKALGGSAGGANGSFSADVLSLDPTEQGISLLSSIIPQLSSDENDIGGFTKSLAFRVRSGDVNVDTYIKSHAFGLIADHGAIDVTPSGVIDASGTTGGTISLQASGSIILEPSSSLSVHADNYDSAGKGGSVFLSAATEEFGQFNPNAVLDLQTGSAIDLGVTAPPVSTQNLSGVLHLRAPVTLDASDIQIAHMDGEILAASSIQVEGYRLYDLTLNGGSSAEISGVSAQALSDARSFFGGVGQIETPTASVLARLTANLDPLTASLVNLAPGVEIINQTSGLTLSSDWDLSTWRFGVNSTPGFLTLRSAGNINFNGSLSDGFTGSGIDAKLLSQNMTLPANFQSWSCTIVAGSDLSGAGLRSVQQSHSGSILVGKVPSQNTDLLLSDTSSGNPPSPNPEYIQYIRTGTGDISLSASADIVLQNELSTIYTAGGTAPGIVGFDAPERYGDSEAYISLYPAQYSFSGGNLDLNAMGSIRHNTVSSNGQQLSVSSQFPNNWIQRYKTADGSLSWWVDFSNFFEGVGVLGGGNVSMAAGADISNVDASIPTNYRLPTPGSGGVELGGGNLTVITGGDLLSGVYYVENGMGSINVMGSIRPDVSARNMDLKTSSPESTALPTTLFAGRSQFDVSAGIGVTLGPMANPFLLPMGLPLLPSGSDSANIWMNNVSATTTYFSTYSDATRLSVKSLSGDVLFDQTVSTTGFSGPAISSWINDILLPENDPATSSLGQVGFLPGYRPWLKLTTASVGSLEASSLLPSTISIQALGGSVNVLAATFTDGALTGGVTLAPSSTGNLEVIASGAVNGLVRGAYGRLNVSDADPLLIYSGDLISAGKAPASFTSTSAYALDDSGSTAGSYSIFQTQALLHDVHSLHATDHNPVQIFAGGGDISGLTLITPKSAKILAAGDISDVAFYMQNVSSSDISVVSSGGTIVLNDPNSRLRKAQTDSKGKSYAPAFSLPGDLQLSGPGALEVTAVGSINLGSSAPGYNGDDTLGRGITSIGNARNPNIQESGADVVMAAGIQSLQTLGIDKIFKTASESIDSGRYMTDVSYMLKQMGNDGLVEAFAKFASWDGLPSSDAITSDQKNSIALVLFDVMLRDAGRDHNDVKRFSDAVLSGPDGGDFLKLIQQNLKVFGLPSVFNVSLESVSSKSTLLSDDQKNSLGTTLYSYVRELKGKEYLKNYSNGYMSYQAGEKAIEDLFSSSTRGDIITSSRDIRSSSGGSVNLLAPGGALTLQTTQLRDTSIGLAPPPPGIVTERGGSISIYTQQSVNLGISRIFTLLGGDIMIWSDKGDVAAGASKKTVLSAPPTRVSIDPQSGQVKANLGGLATGGGIGALEGFSDAPPSNVDLIAPSGVIDAGDAGIRSSGNLNLAATKILNADNIAVAGVSVGAPPAAAPAPAPPPAAPPAAAPPAAASAAAAANNTAANNASKNKANEGEADPTPSVFDIDILGYGGGDGVDEADDSKTKAADARVSPVQASL